MGWRTTALIGALVLTAGIRQTSAPTPQIAAAVEFPPYDRQLLAEQTHFEEIAAASRAFIQEPDRARTLGLLLSQERIADSAVVLNNILSRQPDEIFDALDILGRYAHWRNGSQPFRDERPALLEVAHQRLLMLPRERGAHAARQLLSLEGPAPASKVDDAYRKQLEAFVREYVGTEEAALAEIDLIGLGRFDKAQLEALDAFARSHPASVPGARALAELGFHLATNVPFNGLEPRGSDPIERFLKVLAIVNALEHGSYPRCEWVERAPGLVVRFSTSYPSFAPGSVDRMLAGYAEFVRTHPGIDDRAPFDDGVGHIITRKMAELFTMKGDATGVERTLDDLATGGNRPAFLYAKATYYQRQANERGQPREALLGKARQTLEQIRASDAGPYSRRALATIACLEFTERDFAAASQDFQRYLAAYPNSAYAWVAALRLGRSEEAQGHWQAAAAAYRRAAEPSASNPAAHVLGYELAARALEGAARFDEALTAHERALDAWPPDRAYEYSFSSPLAGQSILDSDKTTVRVAPRPLANQVEGLRAMLAVNGGALVEQGRWLIDADKPNEAIAVLERMVKESGGSPAGPAARALTHRAKLDAALLVPSDGRSDTDSATRIAQLEALAGEPMDEAVCVAAIARATLLGLNRSSRAAPSMRAALDGCRALGLQPLRTGTPSALDADVVAIRNAVFTPLGGGVYSKTHWNDYQWPATLPPFLIVDPQIEVATADKREIDVVVRDPFPGMDNVVFMSNDQIVMLNHVMTTLGGTDRREPGAVMEVPNQPVGRALDILAFWQTFFMCRQGHWMGWEFLTYPSIRRIEFLDAEHTTAAVPVIFGYTGGTALLEKDHGVWRVTALVNQWIT